MVSSREVEEESDCGGECAVSEIGGVGRADLRKTDEQIVGQKHREEHEANKVRPNIHALVVHAEYGQ